MKACKKAAKTGRIHSFETFGTHEGPGIRFVIFMQGCLARCLYCQNPDTWDLNAGKEFSPEEVFKKIKNCKAYIDSSQGGITASGGEPLLQTDFLIELFKLCKNESIHTAIDTSGFSGTENNGNLKKLVELTDLFIVDIKAPQDALHEKITSRGLDEALTFINMLEDAKKSYWVRYVLVPGLNNSKENLEDLRKILDSLKQHKKFEFLPYHTLGRHKWGALNLKYQLDKFSAATASDIKKAEAGLKNSNM